MFRTKEVILFNWKKPFDETIQSFIGLASQIHSNPYFCDSSSRNIKLLHRLPILFFLICYSTVCTYAQEHKKVVAVKGDGIYSLLRSNGLDPKIYIKSFIELNRENLSSENGLFIGRTYLLPTLSEKVLKPDEEVVQPDSVELNTVKATEIIEKREYAIFGPKYSTVYIESKQLEGAVFYLIAGHGGPDPGAVETYEGRLISEDEYAYDVTLRLARKLIANGALVYLIVRDPNDGIRDERVLKIDNDELTYPAKTIPRNHTLRLKQRVQTINDLYEKNKYSTYQRLIETHVDSRSKGENIDVFFYHHEASKNGKRLAESIQNTFKQKYARYQPNRRYSGTVEQRSDLYIIKNTKPPVVYIEVGNLKSTKDQRRILDYENRDAMAKWIAEGVIADYKLH